MTAGTWSTGTTVVVVVAGSVRTVAVGPRAYRSTVVGAAGNGEHSHEHRGHPPPP